jgi:hypothetical protein
VEVEGKVARRGLNGRIRSDEMTRFIYALKEIRACLEAELLTDVQRRLALLSRDMDNHDGQPIPHQPVISVDLIGQRSKQNRPWKVVMVRCGFDEDRDLARARYFAAHPRIEARMSCSSGFAMMRN